MQSDDEILTQAAKHVREGQEHLRSRWAGRMREAYTVKEGIQWVVDDYNKVKNDGLTPYTVNLTAPIVNAVIGFQVQNRSEVSYTPRLMGESEERAKQYADLAQNGVGWIEDVAMVAFHDSAAFADMVICGVGVTDTAVDYDHNEFGLPIKERVFPGFALWDTSAAQKNMLDKNWCCRMKVVRTETLGEEIDEDDAGAAAASFDDSYALDWFDQVQAPADLTVVYDYQWRRKEFVYLIPNPFADDRLVNDPLVMNWLAEASGRLGFEYVGGYISLGRPEFSAFKREVAALNEQFDAGIEPAKAVRKSKWRYYRARIANGRVVSKSLNFCQHGFSLKFMTGNYSETERVYYGMVWDLADPQRLLNQAITDIAGYFRSIPKGGVNIEEDAVDNLKDFIATYGKARDVTVFKKGALSGGKAQPKQPAPLPPGLLDSANIYADLMVRVAGLTPQFMGMIETKNMTGVLHAQLVQQGLTVLSPYFDGKKFYVIGSGRMYIDLLRVLAQNQPERPIRNVTGVDKSRYVPLLEDNLAADYDVEISDVPLTSTQKQETFEKMMDMSAVYAQSNPALSSALAAEGLDYSPLRPEQVAKIKQAATPLPAPPNPMEQMLVEAETKAKIAEAGQKEADAYKKTMEAAAIVKNELHAAPTPEPPAAAAPDPTAVVEAIAAVRREGERDAAERRHKEREHEHRRELAEADLAQRAARDEEEADARREQAAREDRKLALEERRLALEERKLDRPAEPAEAPTDAGAEAARATADALGRMTDSLGGAVAEAARSAREAAADTAKALTAVGRAVETVAARTADATTHDQAAAAVAGVTRVLDRVIDTQADTARAIGKMDRGLAAWRPPSARRRRRPPGRGR